MRIEVDMLNRGLPIVCLLAAACSDESVYGAWSMSIAAEECLGEFDVSFTVADDNEIVDLGDNFGLTNGCLGYVEIPSLDCLVVAPDDDGNARAALFDDNFNALLTLELHPGRRADFELRFAGCEESGAADVH